ncbi:MULTISPECIES: 3-oxoacid CoA-transferase subunit B [Sutcliffiella]|uniref:Acyl CoA:acetate/3-ketoacid CoA transferase subunit beta n=1 Tax=Sutcliffiella cohnii TaxID=33932 RepID=A0A223KQI2_9BACI|nr:MULTISPECIES: 3-oxoacid CoA-transferase subunit B [Sutcliffiella]AST91761.1 acyl CoA:acetate/3-ketoacid CoA transferase subunit beta [Sutcliffiella cohnii]MED4014684.1 3-oxoacid CoA-transferase subunit B [Sutcliffiella cohnii]WBL12978.1 3-oxoacid CoA-transferase subunit B [Sutcliffiella sp. NC1]
MGMGRNVRELIAKRAAREIRAGMIVNLGIGIPSLVPNFIGSDMNVMFHAENGILGMGPTPYKGSEDENLCNAAGYPVTTIKGSSFFDSSLAFGMIRKGKLDITILGSLQVSEKGDLANWIVPGKRVPGMGGAMELSQKAKKVIVVMNHTNRNGESKIVRNCSLPITTPQCVNMIITEMGVMEINDNGIMLTEVMPSYSIEHIIECTEANLKISPHLKVVMSEREDVYD